MLRPVNRQNATLTVITALALLATSVMANAQDSEENLNRSVEKLDYVGPLPDRPTLIGDRLVWDDRALADLCSELKGTFRKLAGRSEYMCRLARSVGGTVTMQFKHGE